MKLKRIVITIVSFLSLWMVTGCSSDEVYVGKENTDFPPSMTGLIHVGETEYEMTAGEFRWEWKNGSQVEVVQTDAASPNQIAEELEAIVIESNSNLTFEIDDNPEIDVYLWNTNGRDKVVPVHNYEISAPSHVGKYIYEVIATWSTGEVSYTFVVDIN